VRAGIAGRLLGSSLVPLTSNLIREAFQQPACKSGVTKYVGRDEWSVTTASHHLGARTAESARI
jgi:hypothetical protein